MKAKLFTLDAKEQGEVALSDAIFGLEPRKDILHRVVEWQRAKARAGTHKTKNVSEISGTTKKPWAQKGTGRARQGSLRSPQFRGGAVIFGPVVRSHATALPKKVRVLGLKCALSAKAQSNQLVVLKDASLKSPKTKDVKAIAAKFGWKSVLIIDGDKVCENFLKASANLHMIDVLPSIGANVYDILRHENLVLTESAIKNLEARLA